MASAPIMQMSVTVSEYGLRGTGVILVDRRKGRYIRRFNVGPASDGDGFDGKTAWISDAGNAVYPQGNADTRARIRTWAKLLQRFGTKNIPRSARIRVGEDRETVTFSDLRRIDGAWVPYTITETDAQGVRQIRVTRLTFNERVPASAFSPPVLSRDFGVRGASPLASVPLVQERIGNQALPLLVVRASVNGARLMRFLVDTGGQNILSEPAAQALHLRTRGSIQIGGAGSGSVAASFTTVRSLRLGNAYMNEQPFLVLPLGNLLPGIDGIVGAELLSRFAARIDYARQRLELSVTDPKSWLQDAVCASIAFDKNMPDVGGVVDGAPGRFTLDTGSVGGLDLNAPFSRSHSLYKTYAGSSARSHITGVGGRVEASRIAVRELRLGAITMRNVPARLTYPGGGVTDDPTIAGNIGERIFDRYNAAVFEYRRGVFAVMVRANGTGMAQY